MVSCERSTSNTPAKPSEMWNEGYAEEQYNKFYDLTLVQHLLDHLLTNM